MKRILLLLLCLASSQAISKAGEFLKIGIGGRGSAMGGAFVASSFDIEGVFSNPAALSFSQSPEVLFGMNEWLADTRQSYIAASLPVQNYIVGFGLNYLDLGKTQETTRDFPQGTGRFYSAENSQAMLTLSGKINENIGIGSSIGIVREWIDDVKGEGLLLNLGLILRPIESISFGFSLNDLTLKKPSFIEEESPVTIKFKGGVAYIGEALPLVVEASLGYIEDEKTGFGIGCEYILKEMIAFRAGYSRRLTDIGDGIGMGLGFLREGFEIRYAFLPSDIENIHRLSMLLKFGKKASQEKPIWF